MPGGGAVRKNHESWEEQRPDGESQSGVILVKSHNSMDQTTIPDNTTHHNNTAGIEFIYNAMHFS